MSTAVGSIKFPVKPDAVARAIGVTDGNSFVVGEVYSIKDVDLNGKWVLLKAENMKPQYRKLTDLLVKATGGFGCNPSCVGKAVFTEDVFGKSERFDRYEVEGWVLDSVAESFIRSIQAEAEEAAVLSSN